MMVIHEDSHGLIKKMNGLFTQLHRGMTVTIMQYVGYMESVRLMNLQNVSA